MQVLKMTTWSDWKDERGDTLRMLDGCRYNTSGWYCIRHDIDGFYATGA